MSRCWIRALLVVLHGLVVGAGCTNLDSGELSNGDASIMTTAGSGGSGSPPTGGASSGGTGATTGTGGTGASTTGDAAVDAGEVSTGSGGSDASMSCMLRTYYRDDDEDGFGASDQSMEACEPPAGYVSVQGDCADDCPTCNDEGSEICDGLDNDCDEQLDEGTDETCGMPDGVCEEGVRRCEGGVLTACEGEIGPGTEICDTSVLDEDCDGTADEGCACAGSGSTPCGETKGECRAGEQPCVSGHLGECTGGVRPVTEACDGKDNDCDDAFDEDVGTRVCGQSTGECSPGVESCVSGAWRCQGGQGPVTESCDERDNDCDGPVDEGLGSTWYRDSDGDGYGSSLVTRIACTMPAGYVANSTDCNDSAAAINPAALDNNCDGANNDCDGNVDEAGGTLWYRDGDGDGYGLASNSQRACSRPVGYVADSTDCNDSAVADNPGAMERCDNRDNNCTGGNNEGNVCCGDGVRQSNEACDTGINGWNCSDACTAISGRTNTAYQECFEDGAPSICNTTMFESCASPGGSGNHLQCMPWDFGEGCTSDSRYTIGRAPNSPLCWLTCTSDANCPDHMRCISSGAGSDNAPALICVPK